jgi:hypothetical protein
MSPAETQARVEELNKANLTNLWISAVLYRMSEGKKFPKKPQDLWEKPASQMSDEALVKFAKTMAARQEREAIKAPKANKRKRRSDTILRPEDP